MGLRFSLEHASLVGWLTRRDFPAPLSDADWAPWPDPILWEQFHDYRRRRLELEGEESNLEPWRAPRVPRDILLKFLEALPESVVTRHPEYLESLQRMVSKARNALPPEQTGQDVRHEVLSSNEVARTLAPLRRWFDVPFYFLLVGSEVPLERFRDSPDYSLWLQCDDTRKDRVPRDLVDPFPPLRDLFGANSFAPVTLCWTWGGDSAVIPHETASAERLLSMVRQARPWRLWSELKSLHKVDTDKLSLLQLSDLHFGAREVSPRQVAYVEQQLRDRIDRVRNAGGVVQPIITGDLMDTPKDKNLAEFEAFRNRLSDYAKTPVIYIPGNHDMRKKGFLWRKWEAFAGLEWNSIVPSDVCNVVFVCFDTSKDAILAQGKITDKQFLDVETKLAESKRLKNYSDYIFVSLVHHHPFSTTHDEVDTLPMFGIREEPFLRMENGDELVRWCAANNIPLILHGHKHKPRFMGQEVEIEGRTRLVRAVGCGSTLGVEGKPLSFNWITWQPATRTWTVSFYADTRDGYGFVAKRLAMGPSA